MRIVTAYIAVSILTPIGLACAAPSAPPSPGSGSATALDNDTALGIASRYKGDRDIRDHPDVVAFYTFGSEVLKRHKARSIKASGDLFVVSPDWEKFGFEPLLGSALAFRVKKGEHYGGSFSHFFTPEDLEQQPEELYFRYYLRFGDDWNGKYGKLPGFGGTYDRAGWGGRPADGENGWSARGAFTREDRRHVFIGTYCYHADMAGDYGDKWLWDIDDRGLLELNRWYCVEQHLKLNTPGQTDGVVEAWIDGQPAFAKRDVRFRDTPNLKIERVWCNVYHGGKITARSEDHLFIDNLVISKRYIGPLTKAEPAPPKSPR